MTRRLRTGRRRDLQTAKAPLHIAQGNVGKGSAQHTAFLQLCWVQKADIILVQEPWVSIDGQCKINTHPGYNTYVPVDSWSTTEDRPRVMTYVRKGNRMDVQQLKPWQSRDLLAIEADGITIVNVYKPDGARPRALQLLYDFIPPPNCIIGGDFNSYYELWEPGVTTHNDGNGIANWAESNGLAFIGQIGVPTSRAGHVIDLTFSDIPFASARATDDLLVAKDHSAILITVPRQHIPRPPRTTISVPDEKLETFAGLVGLGVTELPYISTNAMPEEIDQHTEHILKALVAALDTAGTKSGSKGHNAPWWTEKCQQALTRLRRAKRNIGSEELWKNCEERREFLGTVRREKLEYWRRVIDAVDSDQDLYKVVNWHKLGPNIKAPALNINGKIIWENTAKADALRETLLERVTDDEDLTDDPFEVPVVPRAQLPWQDHISLEEVTAATINVKSTSPGTDGITVRLLKASWEHIREHIRRLFEACLRTGYHPVPLRTAEVVMLRKPDKKNYTDPRAWRPIALLSCIGKGLERLVARRMARIALQHTVISPQQAGALPTRSATDLLACLVHEIEHALENGMTATAVTLDVKGAFDAALRRRLQLRLRQQGWPTQLIRFIGTFMENRSARIRLEETTTPVHAIKCGLPQGSPVSPILFLLYIADIFLDDPKLRFGYADDIALYRTSPSLEENAELLGKDLTRVMDWGKENKVALDPKKGEVIHFSRRCKGPAKTSAPDIVSSKHNYTIKPTDKPAVRWLGVWFDRRLKFSHHIQERVGKANKLVQHLRNLSNTKRGPPANLLRKAIITCVIPVLLYGAEAWYEGPTKAPQHIAHARLGNVATMQAEGINKIDETIRNAIRAIMPVWKTTPNNTLYRDTGVPTARVALEDARHRFGLRIQAVHKDHPLAARAQREMWKKRFHNRRSAGALKPPQTRLQRASMLPETFPRPRQALGKRLTAAVSVTNNRNKKEAAKEFQQWQKDLPDTHLVAFSDGSQDEKGAVGWGYAIYRDGRKIAQGKGRLGIAEVFDGEAEGARNALKRACQIDAGAQIHICIDNTSVIAGLLGDAPTSSQDAFLEFQEIAQAVAVNVRWAPGHEDIEGNEEADRLAKEGTKMLMGNPSISATYAAAKRKIRETRDRHFRDWWQEALPRHRSYHALDLKTATLKCPRELSLPRGTLHHLLACRSTHGDFQSYHRRFNHKDATKCTCGRIKTPEHLVFCRKVQRLRSQWPQLKKEPQNDREYWTELIRQPERFAAFLEMTRFYEKICPNARTTQTQSRTSESRPRTSQPMETQEQASPS
jgi:ribonuclease HI